MNGISISANEAGTGPASGVRYVPPYAATKHTTSTNLIRGGVNAMVLQRFLGHADARSTEHYVVLGSFRASAGTVTDGPWTTTRSRKRVPR